MTACPVHVVRLPGCPHENPADTYRASQRNAETVEVTPNVRVTADDYPEYGPGTVTQVDGRWAVVVFDSGAGPASAPRI